jgi:hypothetical protein
MWCVGPRQDVKATRQRGVTRVICLQSFPEELGPTLMVKVLWVKKNSTLDTL